MIIVDPKGKLFDERRKEERRTIDEEVDNEKRVEDRRKDEWVKDLKDENQKD